MDVRVCCGVHFSDWTFPANLARMQHRDAIGDGADRAHVVGDGQRGGAHLGDDLADQCVDHPGHDRVEPGGRLVEKDDLGLGGDGARKPHALLHAARKLGGQAVSNLGAEADAAQLLDGDLAGLAAGTLEWAAQQAEGDVLPDRERVKEGRSLKQHAEAREQRLALAARRVVPVDGDAAAVGGDEPEDALQQHRLARARAADDHHRAALGHMQAGAAQHGSAVKILVQLGEGDHAEKNTPVSRKLAARMRIAAASTEDLVARPTPCAPRPECMPQ